MKRVWLLPVVLLLGACAGVPSGKSPSGEGLDAWHSHRERLEGLDEWTATGRISIRSENRTWSATLQWRQTGEHYRIRLVAPLGQGGVEIEGGPGDVTLRTTSHEIYHASDPDHLLVDTLGWRIPVRGLRYWILGLPDPGQPMPVIKLDDQGRLQHLEQTGWDIEYPGYTPAREPMLPRKLYLRRSEFQVRLVVTEWQTNHG